MAEDFDNIKMMIIINNSLIIIIIILILFVICAIIFTVFTVLRVITNHTRFCSANQKRSDESSLKKLSFAVQCTLAD